MAFILNNEKSNESLNDVIKEFIDSSRSSLDEKINNIILMLKTLKEENEKNITKLTTFCEKNNPQLLINNNIIINQNLTEPKITNSNDTETNNNKPKIQIKKNKNKNLDKSENFKRFSTSSNLINLNKSSNLRYSLNNNILNNNLQNKMKKRNSLYLKKYNNPKPNKITINKLKKSRSILIQEEKLKSSSKKNVTLQKSLTNSKNSKTSLVKISECKELSSKENAILILCKSPTLRLCEQIMFSRSSAFIKKKTSINEILSNHLIILENKISELKNEIILCTTRIKKPFVASKIADISLNFITEADEQIFKEYDNIYTRKKEKDFYYNFIKILYYIFNEKFDTKADNLSLKKNLFIRIFAKGYNLKDYLYFCYISNKKEKPNFVIKIDEINEIIKKTPNLLDINETYKKCRFISFSIYLIKEIVNYANNIKDTTELQFKAENFLEIVIDKKNKTKDKLNLNQKLRKYTMY